MSFPLLNFMLLPPICMPPSFSLKKGPYVIAFFLFVFPLKRAIIFFYFCWSICFRFPVQVLYMYNTLYWTWINLIRWLSLKKRWTSHIIHFRWTTLRTTSMCLCPILVNKRTTDCFLLMAEKHCRLYIIHVHVPSGEYDVLSLMKNYVGLCEALHMLSSRF